MYIWKEKKQYAFFMCVLFCFYMYFYFQAYPDIKKRRKENKEKFVMYFTSRNLTLSFEN